MISACFEKATQTATERTILNNRSVLQKDSSLLLRCDLGEAACAIVKMRTFRKNVINAKQNCRKHRNLQRSMAAKAQRKQMWWTVKHTPEFPRAEYRSPSETFVAELSTPHRILTPPPTSRAATAAAAFGIFRNIKKTTVALIADIAWTEQASTVLYKSTCLCGLA